MAFVQFGESKRILRAAKRNLYAMVELRFRLTYITGKGVVMSTAANYVHIELDSNGVARIARSRYKVRHLAAEHFLYGWSGEELLRQHSDLKPAEVYSALTYFYDHFDAIVAEIETAESAPKDRVSCQVLAREELLKRFNNGNSAP